MKNTGSHCAWKLALLLEKCADALLTNNNKNTIQAAQPAHLHAASCPDTANTLICQNECAACKIM